MTSPEQIEQQITKEDILPYLHGVYDGYVPESLIEQFRIAVMHLPVTAHRYSMEDVEKISLRNPKEVTVRELGMIINVVFSIPFVAMYESLEEGIAKTMIFEKIKDDYNKSTAAFERKVEAKRKRLLGLSGVGNSTKMGGNGMKIIPSSK